MDEPEKRSMRLEIARATKSKILYSLLWCSLSSKDFLRGQFDLDEVVSFVRASTSKADELFRLICTWGEDHEEDLKRNGGLLAAFTRLIGCIEVADLSQEAVDEFERGQSHFRLNPDCRLVLIGPNCFFGIPTRDIFLPFRKHILDLTKTKKRLLVCGQAKGGNGKTDCVMTLPQFEQDGQMDVRFPRLEYRGVASLNGKSCVATFLFCLSSKKGHIAVLFVFQATSIALVENRAAIGVSSQQSQ